MRITVGYGDPARGQVRKLLRFTGKPELLPAGHSARTDRLSG